MYLLTPAYENPVFLDEKILSWEEELLPGATFRNIRQFPRNGTITALKFNIGEDQEGLIRVRFLKDHVEIVPWKAGWLLLMSPRPSWALNISYSRNSPLTFEAENLSGEESVTVQCLVSIRYRLEAWEIQDLGLGRGW